MSDSSMTDESGRYERFRESKLRQWYQDSQSADTDTQRNARIRLQLQLQLRARRAEFAQTMEKRNTLEPGRNTEDRASRKGVKRRDAWEAAVRAIIAGEQAMTDGQAHSLVKKWKKAAPDLGDVLGDAEWDEPADFRLNDGDDDSDAEDLRFTTVPGKAGPLWTSAKKKYAALDDAAKAAANEALQQRFVHTRAIKLRQWYMDAHANDTQAREAAQVRLHVQFLLRDQRAHIQDCMARRDMADDEDSRSQAGKKLKKAHIAASMFVQMASGEKEVSERLAKQAAKWWKEGGPTLEQVLGEMEWDRPVEYGVWRM